MNNITREHQALLEDISAEQKQVLLVQKINKG